MLLKLILAIVFLFEPLQAVDTFVSVNYTLSCSEKRHFEFHVKLLELDNIRQTHDTIAEHKGKSFGQYDGYLFGTDTWDGVRNNYYEFALFVKHTCVAGGAWKEEPMRELKEPCAVNAPRCIFPMERFQLIIY